MTMTRTPPPGTKLDLWSVKYWQSHGIQPRPGCFLREDWKYAYYPKASQAPGTLFDEQLIIGRTAFKTLEEAQARLRLLIKKRIHGLTKQIQKLEEMLKNA